MHPKVITYIGLYRSDDTGSWDAETAYSTRYQFGGAAVALLLLEIRIERPI